MHIIQRFKGRFRRALLRRLGASPAGARPRRLSRYEHLLDVFRGHNPGSMVEIGVWRGDRTVRFIEEGRALQRYVGFDLFEDISEATFQAERMGECTPHSREGVMQRIAPLLRDRSCTGELVAGRTEETLTNFAQANTGQFDFVYVDGGHSVETIASDWAATRQLVKPGGLVVFDDYYLNDATRGAKSLIDSLVAQGTDEVRFFPMIEDIIENLQITMVAVRPRVRK